jgi:hypothetical protein
MRWHFEYRAKSEVELLLNDASCEWRIASRHLGFATERRSLRTGKIISTSSCRHGPWAYANAKRYFGPSAWAHCSGKKSVMEILQQEIRDKLFPTEIKAPPGFSNDSAKAVKSLYGISSTLKKFPNVLFQPARQSVAFCMRSISTWTSCCPVGISNAHAVCVPLCMRHP